MRGGQRSAGVNNPSQDSAFGSMTDGEQSSIASSSMRLSSFQSISSPIDEGVEDISSSLADLTHYMSKDSTDSNAIARSTSDSVALLKNGMDIPLEPPKILVNGDQSTFYTTSPSKASCTVEVFSQKYRVSSFEDMSLRRTPLKNVNKLAFRSLEEERRIDSAFQPPSPSSSSSLSTNNVLQQPVMAAGERVHNNEKFKKLTHAAFSRKITSTKERHTKWKNSILARKNVMIKSNESLLDHHASSVNNGSLHKRVSSSNELSSRKGLSPDRDRHLGYFSSMDAGGSSFSSKISSSSSTSTFNEYPRKSCSERQLFSLCSFNQRTVTGPEYDAVDEEDRWDDGFGLNRTDVVSFIDDSSSSSSSSSGEEDGNGEGGTTESSSSPSHRDVCQIIGGFVGSSTGVRGGCGSSEEKRPLLDGMEMSPLSPVAVEEACAAMML